MAQLSLSYILISQVTYKAILFWAKLLYFILE